VRQSVTTDFAAYLLEGKAPDHLAMLTLTGQHTYGEIYRGTESVASWLRENDVRKGDRVLLLADNSLFWVAAYLGTMHAGCVVVPLAPTISAGELAYVVAVAEPRCAFVQPRYAGQKATSLAGVRVLTELPDTCCASDQSNHLQHSSLGLDDLAALMFTSGSTGKPRGVMVTHGNLIANTESIVEYLELSKEDRILAVLPFNYCFGASLLHTHLRVGGSIVVEPRFMFLESTLQRMKATECTGFAGVPSHYQILLRKSNIRQTEFPHLRYIQQAGGHLAPAFVQELRAALPRTKIYIMYGQTEATARLAYLPPDLLTEKFGSIGKAIPGVALEVLDEAGQSVKPGQVGEIVAEGANVTKGYWHDEEASLVSFRNGRLYTGDLATVDEDGFIYVVDRARDFLKCGGKRVSCRQIESTILEFQELQEAAVIGLPDPVLGEAVKAFVVPCDIKARDIPERLLAFCRTRLPAPFVPKEIVVMASLPKNTAGKILKPLLAQASVSK
jgi:long-chain acyl-CoA synthetase